MKINVRLLLITFIIVVLITVTSTLIFYSLAITYLKKQNSELLLKSANDFIFNIQSELERFEEEYTYLKLSASSSAADIISVKEIDFKLNCVSDRIIRSQSIFFDNEPLVKDYYKFSDLINDYPNIIIRSDKMDDSTEVYYGKILEQNYLDDKSQKIGAELALDVNFEDIFISNSFENDIYYYRILQAIDELKFKNNFDFTEYEMTKSDFFATYYKPKLDFGTTSNLAFLIFKISNERVQFKEAMLMFVGIILTASVLLTLIFVLLFTAKLRRQINYLTTGAQLVASGVLDHRIKVISKDEIGKLSEVFNSMVSELEKKDRETKEYSDFLSLINKNPGLSEITELSLEKIIANTDITLGSFYIVENGKSKLIASKGIERKLLTSDEGIDYHKKIIKNKESLEFKFDKNYPVIRTGIVEMQIKYLFIMPILFNDEVIAIIELAAQEIPRNNITNYIGRINKELAVGITNALSLEKLENFVNQLRELNEEYLLQNEKIKSKNRELLELHQQLKIKAAELEEQKNKAEELALVKSQFLANMSHELRTPLNSIIGLTELVASEQLLSDKAKERVTVVLRNGHKLLSLINNILEFSKIDAGRVEVNDREFMLSDFINDIVSSIEPLAEDKNLEFIVEEIPGKDFVLKTDKFKLEQIVTNLLSNAVKFTNIGYLRLDISESINGGLSFSVTDTGMGIPEKDKKIIFDAFRQSDETLARKFGGTGLGLSICSKYVNMLNGSLNFESKEGKGSTFTVVIPRIIEKELSLEIQETKKPEIKDERKSILVIDPLEENRNLFKNYLAEKKYFMSYYKDSNQVLQKLNNENHKAVIINSEVDGIGFLNLMKKIKSTPDYYKIPIIITSFIPDQNIGYGLLVHDIIFIPNRLSEVSKMITRLKLVNDKPVIAVFDYEINETDNDWVKQVEIKNYSDFYTFADDFDKSKPALIVMHLMKVKKGIDIIANMNASKKMRKIPIILLIDENVSSEFEEEFKSALKKITIERQHHKFDVLKVLKDRLNIATSDRMRDKLLEPEQGAEIKIRTDVTELEEKEEQSILLVDDDPDTLYTVGEIISELGYKTIFASNGNECLNQLKKQIPNLILLDIMMPVLDGFETIKRIKSIKEYENVPVVALTAYAMINESKIIERNGFAGLITKPIDRKELIERIKKFLNVEAI